MPWKRPNNGSRMNREVHVRFWESPEVKVLRATRQKGKMAIINRESAVTPAPEVGGRGRPNPAAGQKPPIARNKRGTKYRHSAICMHRRSPVSGAPFGYLDSPRGAGRRSNGKVASCAPLNPGCKFSSTGEDDAGRTRDLNRLASGRELAGFGIDPERDDVVAVEIGRVEPAPGRIETEEARG